MIVIDASAIGIVYLRDEDATQRAIVLDKVEREALIAPAHLHAEVMSLVRKAVIRGRIDRSESVITIRAASVALQAIQCEPQPPLEAILQLSFDAGLTPYDAGYLELAMRHGCALLTADRRLSDVARGSERAGAAPIMTIVTRFAPSPTGRLHVGNLRAALHNWLFARKSGGTFLLRLDDTDAVRSDEGFVAAIRADLDWLGLTRDGEARQSERFAVYEKRFAALLEAGRVYPCYETPQELDLKRKVQLGRGLPPVYDRAALVLSDADRDALEAEGREPHWRFRLDHEAPIGWEDLIRGPQHFDPHLLGDPVIRRADGSWLYMLPSAIDDIELGISHVVRGEDHVSNTAAQLQMFTAMGAAPPAFAHEALLVGSEGKLSKRLGATDADAFRAAGIEPLALAALLARIGTSQPVEPVVSLDTLVAGFDFAHFGRAPARFDEAELGALNARVLHMLDFVAVSDRLPQGMDARAWEAIRPNIDRIEDAADWWRVIEGPIEPPAAEEQDRAFLAEAGTLASKVDWSADPWHQLTDALKASTGRRGKGLFLPLRRALTGLDHGPDMSALLPLIGRARAVERLSK